MSRTAILYDVHGNLAALRAVLGDAHAAGAEQFVLGGDYALFGPAPAETVVELQSLGEAAGWIRGNVDRWTAHPDQADTDELLQRAIADTRAALGLQAATDLGALQEVLVRDGIRFCHASPRSDLESFLPEPQATDAEFLAGAPEATVVFGHTHLQFRRRHGDDGPELVNPGSVGMPLDGDPRAAYALLEGGEIELRRVAYDHEAAARSVVEAFGEVPWAERSARRLRTATP